MTTEWVGVAVWTAGLSPVWGVLVLIAVFRVRAAWRSLTYTGWHEAKR